MSMKKFEAILDEASDVVEEVTSGTTVTADVEVVVEEAVSEAVTQAEAIADAEAEIVEGEAEGETIVEAIETLQFLKASIEKYGISPQMSEVLTFHGLDKVIEKKTGFVMPASESLAEFHNNKRVAEKVLVGLEEADKNIFQKAWDWIQAQWDKIKTYFKALFGNTEAKSKRVKAMAEKISGMTSPSKVEFQTAYSSTFIKDSATATLVVLDKMKKISSSGDIDAAKEMAQVESAMDKAFRKDNEHKATYVGTTFGTSGEFYKAVTDVIDAYDIVSKELNDIEKMWKDSLKKNTTTGQGNMNNSEIASVKEKIKATNILLKHIGKSTNIILNEYMRGASKVKEEKTA